MTENSLTVRQQNEARVYDERASLHAETLTDQDLLVSVEHPPYPNREHVDFLDHLFDRLGDPAGKRVLEVGCGSGTITTYLALRGAHAVGVDVSEGMLGIAARRAAANGVAERCTFRCSPIEVLDDPAGSYDVVIANQVLHHLELAGAMDNISRLLRPGGRALFAEPVFLLPPSLRQLRYRRSVLKVFPSATDTPDERPIALADLELIESRFAGAERRSFQLSTRLQNFVRLPDPVFRVLHAADRVALGLPGAARLARYVTLELTPSAAPVTTPPLEEIR